MRRTFCLAFAALALGSACHTPGGAHADRRDARVDRVITALEENYVFADTAARAVDLVRKRQSTGRYASLQDSQLAVSLTEDLQAITHDKHLIVSYRAKAAPPPETREIGPDERRRMDDFARSVNYGFTKMEQLPGDIGYLRIDGFMPADVGGPTLAAAMNSFVDARALIIDLRYSDNGGDPSMVALICSYLTAPQSIHLSSMRFRNGKAVENWTSERVAGARYPTSRPVMVLTSRRTFSAGEELAYNLQALRRATIIGEPTGGGANPGQDHWISDHLSIFVPDGEAKSAITGENWGWSGVVPDIRTPADAALTQAEQQLSRSRQDQ